MTPEATTIEVASADGRYRLAARLWTPDQPRAFLVIAHGHGEHGGCYASLAGELVEALEVEVLAFDFRGHGNSSGDRGVIGTYQDLLADLATWLRWASSERAGLPVFILGHSNGGLAAIRLLEGGPLPVAPAGLILTNPSLRLIAEAPVWKRLAGQILLRVAPWVTFDTGIDGDQLTQAPESLAVIEADRLRHHRISAPTYFGMVANGPLAVEQAGRLGVPTLLILGGGDSVTDPAEGRRLFERLGAQDKELLVFDAMRHEPLHEVDRASVVAAIVGWIAARIPPALATGTSDASKGSRPD